MKARTAKKAELLALPEREWGAPEAWWNSLLIVPTRKMHSSGFAHIAIIGVDKDGEAQQILAKPDDIQWPAQTGISDTMPDYGALRTDCFWPSGVLHLWSGDYDFSITDPGSSTEIHVRRTER